MAKIIRMAISRKRIQKKKKLFGGIYFYTSVPIFDSKFYIPIATEMFELFRHLDNWHLMAHQTAKR